MVRIQLKAIYHRSIFSQTYFYVLDKMFPKVSALKREEWPEMIPFVLTCAATLECMLNDTIIDYCSFKFGFDELEKYTKPLVFLPLHQKFDYIFLFLSGNKFTIRRESLTYKHVEKLISLRNSLMHNASLHQRGSTKFVTTRDGTRTIIIPKSKLTVRIQSGLTIRNCTGFLQAVRRINELLSKRNEWKEDDTLCRIRQ